MGIQVDLNPSRQRWVLVLASFAALMSSLDLNIVRLALPAMSKQFQVGSSTVSWVQLIYILVLTCLLLVFGRLGDMWGYRRLFIAGLGIFTAASLAAALAPNIGILLAARAVQAVGGAAMLALTTPIISTFLPKAAHGRAIGIVAGWESLGITLGRFLGGVLVEYLDWRWIFLINLPVGLAALAVSWRVLPEGAIRKLNAVSTRPVPFSSPSSWARCCLPSTWETRWAGRRR